jgi:DNA sulfur modification protein DndE
MIRFFALLLIFISTTSYSQEFTLPQSVSFRADTFNIKHFGGVADGLTKNTMAINKAIASCSEKGGGTVLIPAGFWLTGPIQLRSNVNLHIAKNAVLQFTGDLSDYPLVKTNWEGVDAYRCHSPIFGTGLENIAITGDGILDGAGQAWRPVKKSKVTPPEWKQLTEGGGFLNEAKDIWYPTESSLNGSRVKRPGVIAEGFDLQRSEAIRDFLRPNMLSLIQCKRILLQGVTFQNSPAWCLHPLMSQHITIRDLTVRNPWNAQNGDGVDLESCRYVLIENSTFDVGDDGICLKSGRDEEGRKRGMPTEDVMIRGCTVFHAHGGFVVGSEMSGGVRNIFVSDCNFLGTDIGLRFKSARGRGGIVENIFIKNIGMNNIGGAAILFDMYYMAKDPLTMFSGADNPSMEFKAVSESTPQFRKIRIENVVCDGAETGIFVRGLPEMNIREISMENISIKSKTGFVCIEGEDITLKNSTLVEESGVVVSIQNSKNVTLDNVKRNGNGVMLNVEGERSKNIKLWNTGPLAKEAIRIGKGVSEKVIQKN